MERSPYNTLVRIDPFTHVALNQVSGGLLKVSPQVYRYLQGGPEPRWDDKTYERLVKARFLVESRDKEAEEVQERILEWRADDSAVHYSLVLTYACNLKCPYCYEEDYRGHSRAMSMETAKAAVDHIIAECQESNARFLGLTLYGGEPLLNLPVLRYAVDRLAAWSAEADVVFHSNLITNGTRVEPEIVDDLVPMLKTAQLTLDGARRYHDGIRIGGSGEGTFDRILDAAHIFLDRGVQVLFRIQVTPESMDGIEDCLQQLQTRELLHRDDTGLYFFPIMDVGGVCSAKSFSCYKQYFSPELMKRLGEAADHFDFQPFRLPQPVWQQPYCSFVSQHAWLVDPAGDLYKCVSMIGKPEHKAGSVLNEPNGDDVARYRERAEAFVQRSGAQMEDCQQCEYLPSCDGGCAYRALCTTGSIDTPHCEMHRGVQKEQISTTYRFFKKKMEALHGT